MDSNSSLETLCKECSVVPLKTTIRSNEHALVKNFIKENNEDSSEEERYMIADLDAMDCMMERGMDDECGAVDDDDGDDGSDTEADDDDFGDFIFEENGADNIAHSEDEGGDGSDDEEEYDSEYGGYDPAVIYL
ncbi:unnamed protein product [Oikopleura dioica]|uniref:Uncharacterized protein n=1 Tax=Oikopleura dioica TaxID=34765 RepID=E4X8X8_OIKDI|nr:unnamed protein product [Oikopleura dioica]